MPDRIVKESITTSDSLSRISFIADTVWARFLVVFDDYGCFDARPAILKARLYPLRQDVTVKMIDGWLNEYQNAGMVKLWAEPSGVQFGQCLSFEIHNDIASKKNPKTPCPPWQRTESGEDPRLGTEALHSFERIGVAVAKLSAGGKTPSYREIIKETGCSASTISKYRKHKAATQRYSVLPVATADTPRIRILNPESESVSLGHSDRLPDGFEAFWKTYPLKKAKAEAKKVWIRIRPSNELQEKISTAVQAAIKTSDWTRENGKYIPHPATWLNRGQWDDEPLLIATQPRNFT